MQEVPLSQLCDSMSSSVAKLYNVFVTLIVFQLLLFLTLDFTLCSKQHVTNAQVRPLPCTDESVNGYVQAQVDSTHPALDLLAQAAPSSSSSDDDSEEEEQKREKEKEKEEEEEDEGRCDLQSPRNVLTIVY
jgi:hypothetical protein